MLYSVDLRKRVVNFVQAGGSKAEAARRFSVCEATVYNWLKRDNLKPTKVLRRHRKLDWEALEKHVEQEPSATLKQRAKHFGVNPHAIWYALHQLKITRKKTAKVSGARPLCKTTIFETITKGSQS